MAFERTAHPEEAWSIKNMAVTIPSQASRRTIITGANSGVGYFAAVELARAGAHVLLVARDQSKGEAAVGRLRSEVPSARVELGMLNLASLKSVREFAARELDRGLPLHILINNAGVMAPPKRQETEDGFELQFGVNVLGHFALTALLFPLIEIAASSASEPPRVVYVASIAHKKGMINFEDLQALHSYNPLKTYQQSKLADLMLSFELDRLLKAQGSRVLSLAAHPGVANTNLFQNGNYSPFERWMRGVAGQAIGAILNSGAEGALPTIYAATSTEARGGGYYGPQRLAETRGGDVGAAQVASQARDEAAARRLWGACEELTGTALHRVSSATAG